MKLQKQKDTKSSKLDMSIQILEKLKLKKCQELKNLQQLILLTLGALYLMSQITMRPILLKWKNLEILLQNIYTGEKKKDYTFNCVYNKSFSVASLKKFPSFNSSIDDHRKWKDNFKKIFSYR